MIYTRNKEGFKSKTQKIENKNQSQNLIDSLNKRLQEKSDNSGINSGKIGIGKTSSPFTKIKPTVLNSLSKSEQSHSKSHHKSTQKTYIHVEETVKENQQTSINQMAAVGSCSSDPNMFLSVRSQNQHSMSPSSYGSPIQQLGKSSSSSVTDQAHNHNQEQLERRLSHRTLTIQRSTDIVIERVSDCDSGSCDSKQQLSSTASRAEQTKELYISMLEKQIEELKHKIQLQIEQMKQKEVKKRQNEQSDYEEKMASMKQQLIELNQKLTQAGVSDRKLSECLRFYSVCRCTLITVSMELIELKNEMTPQFYTSSSTQEGASKFEDRILSINKCLAKSEKIIEVSEKILKREERSEVETDSVEQLTELCAYQSKIITKLQKQTHEHYCKSKEDFPYSFIDEIKLLKHEINRLTSESCSLIKQIDQLQGHHREYSVSARNSQLEYWNSESGRHHERTFSKEGSAGNREKTVPINEQEFETLIQEFKHSLLRREDDPLHNTVVSEQRLQTMSITRKVTDHNKSIYPKGDEVSQFEAATEHPQTVALKNFQSKTENLKSTISQLEAKVKELEQQIYKMSIENEFMSGELERLEVQKGEYEQKVRKIEFQKEELIGAMVKGNQNSQNLNLRQSKASEYFELKIENGHLRKQVEMLNKQIQELEEAREQQPKSAEQSSPGAETLNTAKSGKITLEDIFAYLKGSENYHKSLVEIIQKYENKVSLLHDQVAQAKTQQSQYHSLLNESSAHLKTLQSLICSSSNSSSYQRSVVEQAKGLLGEIESVRNGQNRRPKLDYHLMMIKSLSVGIGKPDVQLIEEELSDYLVQLKNRLPTVDELDDEASTAQMSARSHLQREEF